MADFKPPATVHPLGTLADPDATPADPLGATAPTTANPLVLGGTIDGAGATASLPSSIADNASPAALHLEAAARTSATTLDDDMRNKLRQRKGVLMRFTTKLYRRLETRHRGEIIGFFNDMHSAADGFEQLYENFLNVINYVEDPIYNDQWFMDTINNVTICSRQANVFLSSSATPPNVHQEDMKSVIIPNPSHDTPTDSSSLLPSLLSAINLPKLEITPFDGDPLKYHAFIKSFMVNVDRLCTDPDSKIARLIAYTRGPAREAIASVQIVGGEVGYRRALNRLTELFGSKHLITQSIITELACSEPARSPEQVRKLSYRLSHALDVLSDLSALDEVRSQFIIRTLADLLPPFAVKEWDKKQLKSKHKSGAYLEFTDLVNFVSRVADDVNDPVCGFNAKQQHSSLFSTSSTPLPLPAERDAVCHVVSFSDDPAQQQPQKPKLGKAGGRPQCSLCGGDHFISRCVSFKKHSLSMRLSVLRNKKLCFNCLHHDHLDSQCRSLNRCLVCNQKHSTFIHTDHIRD